MPGPWPARGFRLVNAIRPAIVANLGDAQQGIVRRGIKATGIKDGLIFEVQQRRHSLPLMLYHIVGALAQGIQKQNPTLESVLRVGHAHARVSLVLDARFRMHDRAHGCGMFKDVGVRFPDGIMRCRA